MIYVFVLFCSAAVVKRSFSVHWLSMVFYFSCKGTGSAFWFVTSLLSCSLLSSAVVVVPLVVEFFSAFLFLFLSLLQGEHTILSLHDLEVRQSLLMPLWKVTNRGEPLLPFGDRPRLPFEKVLVGRHGGKTFRDDVNRLECRCIIDINESF